MGLKAVVRVAEGESFERERSSPSRDTTLVHKGIGILKIHAQDSLYRNGSLLDEGLSESRWSISFQHPTDEKINWSQSRCSSLVEGARYVAIPATYMI